MGLAYILMDNWLFLKYRLKKKEEESGEIQKQVKKISFLFNKL